MNNLDELEIWFVCRRHYDNLIIKKFSADIALDREASLTCFEDDCFRMMVPYGWDQVGA